MTYKEKYQSFYNSKQWLALRKYKFQQADGLCEECAKKGIVRQGIEVHHIVPISVDWSKRLLLSNLILLCHECHDNEHNRISPLQKFLSDFDNM